MYTSMGRGRKGLIEQSVKKPKRTNNWFKYYDVLEEVLDENDSIFPPDLPKDFLEALKRMEPKEVADILFK